MKIKELSIKTKENLRDMLAKEKERLEALQFKASSKQLKDVRAIRKARQTIAQIMTLLQIESSKSNNKI